MAAHETGSARGKTSLLVWVEGILQVLTHDSKRLPPGSYPSARAEGHREVVAGLSLRNELTSRRPHGMRRKKTT